MPKKAVLAFFILAFVGAALFVFLTFPRTKDEIPKSNNQRPFPSAPQPGPNGLPVPEPAPRPNIPKVPPGPTLRVMAWGAAADVAALEKATDDFGTVTGRHVSLLVDHNQADYQRDLQQALTTGTAPDVILVSSRDFSGLDPERDLADAHPLDGSAARSITAFTVDGAIKAVPAEFSVEMLFYNTTHFDQAGIGYPDRHWNWDILQADARAIESLHLKDTQGHAAYALEIPADFDMWNILCTQAGHPALDLDTWHLGDNDTKESQMRALDFIHDLFQGLTVTAPLPKPTDPPGHLFAMQRATLLIGPSELAATLPKFPSDFTLLPRDMESASLARVNGWAVTIKSTEPAAAQTLTNYLAAHPVHAGWTSVLPAQAGTHDALCQEALGQAVLPRIDAKTARVAGFLDQQIALLAKDTRVTSSALYDHIQNVFQMQAGGTSPAAARPAIPKPAPKIEAATQVRGF